MINAVKDSLRWKKFPVGPDGFVALVDVMGDDAAVVEAARTSYGEGTKKLSTDESLINYLYRHGHGTPFEMVSFKFLVRAPCHVWRQWIGHRTAKVNEYSMRYSVAIDACETTSPDSWRLQAAANRQGSAGALEDWPDGFAHNDGVSPGEYLSAREQALLALSRAVYEERLKFGVAREQARKDLPLSNYTEAYWKMDLRNMFNFLSLRMDSHAQKEIRDYANAIYGVCRRLCPVCFGAFDAYDTRRGAVTLSAHDIRLLGAMINETSGTGGGPYTLKQFYVASALVGYWPAPPQRCRERDECLDKLQRMNVVLAM